MQLGAREAVLVDLVRQVLAIGHGESHRRKKFRNAGEQANAAHLLPFRFVQERLDHSAPRALALRAGMHGDRAHFGKMRTVQVESAAANHLALVFDHDEVADVLADFCQGARQQRAVTGVGGDQFVDRVGVAQDGVTRAHAAPP